jgi:hypothetical protein
MFTNLIAHERTPAHRDDSTMRFAPFFINADPRPEGCIDDNVEP